MDNKSSHIVMFIILVRCKLLQKNSIHSIIDKYKWVSLVQYKEHWSHGLQPYKFYKENTKNKIKRHQCSISMITMSGYNPCATMHNKLKY